MNKKPTNKQFTKEEILEILEGMVDNLECLRDTIKMGGAFDFDLDVLTSFMDYKFDPLLTFLMNVPDYTLPSDEEE